MKKDINTLLQQLDEKNNLTQDKDKSRAEKQHQKGKLSARERIHLLLDEGSFVETDAFEEHDCHNFGIEKQKFPGDGVITGFGTISDRPVYVFSQDFTVLGGSLGLAFARKIMKIQDMALQNGAPVIGINDSGGARIQEGVDALHGYGGIFFRNVRASGVIPQISVIVGPCAGGAVYSPALTDFVFMVQGIGNMFITGPQVIKQVTGEDITSEALGGARVQSEKSGNVHFVHEDEKSCFEAVRTLIDLLPANNMANPHEADWGDPVDRMDAELISLVPTDGKKSYDIHEVIRHVVDSGWFYEVQPMYAANIVTGFARLGGTSVGIIANQPLFMAGCLDIDASDKAARFIRFCDAFSIPLITLVDVPGYLPGRSQEHNGIIRHGAKLLYAYSEATVPKLTVTLRKSYGGASIAMANKDLGCDFMLAWPQAEIAVMGAEGAAGIIFRKEITSAAPEDQARVRTEKIDEYEELFCNPYVAAAKGYVDAVIRPEETRPRLIQALRALRGKRDNPPPRKHGNLPL
jgi:acetyl-CoA carboxylase carboxyltransferase component